MTKIVVDIYWAVNEGWQVSALGWLIGAAADDDFRVKKVAVWCDDAICHQFPAISKLLVFYVFKMSRDREGWIALWVNDPAAQWRWRQPFDWITKFENVHHRSRDLSSAHLMILSWVNYSPGQ